jgi:DNA-binding PucR family transcriptional regulator
MNKLHFIYGFLFLTLLTMSSCGSTYGHADAYSGGSTRMVADISGNSKSKDKSDDVKKVIYNSSIYLTVKIPDTASVRIAEIAKKYNGYVQQSGTTSSVIRVEAHQMNAALNDISSLGKVTKKNSSGQDVTDQYADYAIRLDNAEKARLRYLELLERAENVEAALKVEKELERLNETIELMKGKMNRIDHLTSYSTITVYLTEKKKPGVIGYVGIGLYKAVKWLFVRN